MNNTTKYFRNKLNMDLLGIDSATLWKLEEDYVSPVDDKYKLKIYYKSHEHWYTEVENPVELQEKNN